MQRLAEGFRGVELVIRLNGDSLFTALMVLAALAAGGFVGSLIQPL